MEKRPLGRTDLEVSVLCLGTMMFGDQIDENEAFAQMDACLDRGVNFFDTAELYTIPPKAETQGESERIIGRWMKGRGTRDRVVIASKVTGRGSLPYMRDGDETRLSREQIIAAVERSLRNLQTDAIDLYQTHWPDRPVQTFGEDKRGFEPKEGERIAIEETVRALDELVAAGKVRHIGVSNETAWGVMAHLRASESAHLARIASIQNAYNLLNRTFEQGLAEIAMEEQVGLLAYSPIAQGFLSGKYLGGAVPEGSRKAFMSRAGRYEGERAEAAIADYVALARRFGCDPSAFALQFVTSRPFVTSNIFGAHGLDQLATALESVDLAWTDEMETAVADLFERRQNPCP